MFHFIILTLFIGFSFSQGRIDGIDAVVGSNLILHSDVLQQSHVWAASQGINPSKKPYLFEKIYFETLKNIVDQYTVLGVAEKDTNLIISDDEVDRILKQRIDEFVVQAGSKELLEEALGMSLRKIEQEYWLEIRNMMFIEKYKLSKIQTVDVGRVEVNNFYDVYKDSIPPVPENYTFSVIEVPFVYGELSENRAYILLDSLRGLILSGIASFDTLAKIYSQDHGSAISGGHLDFTERGTLVQTYEEAAYALHPGELSLPVRSKFGYHLIRLIDKKGEKISSQHILMPVSFSDIDKKTSFNLAKILYQKTNNDPFVFDSISIEYKNIYDNFSDVYSNVVSDDIPYFLLDHLIKQTKFKLSMPIETENGYVLIYLYQYNKQYISNLDNSWNLIYQYALQKKKNIIFQNFLEKMKENIYINKYIDNNVKIF